MKPCPRPEKQAHPTEAAAAAHLRSLRKARGMGFDLRVYRCCCGAWHVGNSTVSLADRIQKSLRPGPKRKPRVTRRA